MKKIIRRETFINEGGCDTAVLECHPVLERIYRHRDVWSPNDLNRELKSIFSYKDFSQIDKAISRLATAITNDELILIIGDFDVDGATSTALAVSALQAFGAQFVEYLVPNRFTYGYGLTPGIVEVSKNKQPSVIMTVDNGISSIAGVDKANELGIDVIITDHHLPGAVLPKAHAIVNPNQQGCQFPSKNLAGVGVTFYVMCALRAYLSEKEWFVQQNIPCPNMANFLDLVALGTVADVVRLDKNNRVLVHQGILRMRAGLVRPGIAALMEVAGRDIHRLVSSDLGFIVGPRLNAAGRLDDMTLGIECLLASSLTQALPMAKELDQLNRERRAIEMQMQNEAFAIIEKLDLSQKLPVGVCLYDESWHQGVVGLVASRVKEKLHRPVIAFAKSEDGELKGSARSISGVHIRDVLESVAIANPDIVTKFGGHAMAAGLSIDPEHYDAFSKAFSDEVEKHVTADDLQGIIETDGPLDNEDFTLELAHHIREGGPWGQGFPEPTFDGIFQLVSQRVVGQRHLKLVLQAPNADYYLEGIAFNVDLEKWPNHHCEKVQMVYRLDINEYRGQRRLQLLVDELFPV